MITVLIASCHQSSRDRFARLLSGHPVFRLLDVCADTHAAIAIAAHAHPGIVIIDGSCDPLAAAAATQKILSSSAASVIAVSANLDEAFAHHMLAAGALGYLTTHCNAAEFITALQEVAKDNVYLCSDIRTAFQHPFINTPGSNASTKKPSTEKATSLRKQMVGKIAAAATNHWHGILQFTN